MTSSLSHPSRKSLFFQSDPAPAVAVAVAVVHTLVVAFTGGGSAHVQIGEYGSVAGTCAAPFSVSALTSTGITAPVFRLNTL